MNFEYFDYGEERRFSFLQVPKLLLTEERYRKLSGDAKLLYSLMLDRGSLSRQNKWYDERGHPFIYFTQDDITDSLGIGHSKAFTLLAELERTGLILRVRQGLGKPNRIYVGRFYQEESFADIQNSENRISGSTEIGFQELRKTDTNNTEYKDTEKNDTEKPESIRFLSRGENGSEAEAEMLSAYLEATCGFEALKKEYPFRTDELDGIKALMIETCLSKLPEIRVGKQEKPKGVVESRLKKLNINHIRYVMDCLEENTTNVRNMRQYLLAVLFNAPVTMGAHYQTKYSHDRAKGIV